MSRGAEFRARAAPGVRNMGDRRHRHLDLAACILLVAGFLVALSVFSSDPVSATAISPQTPSANLLGPGGAWLGQSLLGSLGLAVYALLAAWFVFVLLLLLRHTWLTWSLRLSGWLLLVPCAAVLAERCARGWSGAPPEGPGGSVGAWLSLWLASVLRPAGQIVALGGSTLAGLALGLDVLLVPLSRLTWRTAGRLGRFAIRHRLRLRPGRGSQPPVANAPGSPPPIANAPGSPPPVANAPGSPRPAGVHAIPIRHHDEAARVNLVVPDLERFADYELPPLSLLDDPQPLDSSHQDQQLRDRAALLEKTFADFGLNVRVVGINTGPVVTQYEVALETGLRVHKVTRLADDLALNLAVPSVRIVAPLPGKASVGIEIPNELRADVRLKEVILASARQVAKLKLPLFLGKDAEGRPLVHDLAEMPHLLIAGSTGTGKSVCLNAIILSMLMTRRPDEVKMVMIDPKMLEMSEYGRIPHLMHPVVKDMKKAEAILSWAVDKMEERYDLLSRARVRHITAYNALGHKEILRRVAAEDEEERQNIPERMPYIVLFIDEMADLMMMMRKEVEGHIIRLAQKSRAAGIHLVVATQKPTVDVITGLIKSNLPARICFKVVNKTDSRVVLDEMGADRLLGKGDLLFLPPGTSTLVRGQGTYASDNEIQRIVEHLECDPCYAPELMQLRPGGREAEGNLMERLRARDDLYEAAIEVILREGRGSVSLLQRALGIGYGRAARLIDFMAEDGIVGAYNGSSAREVLYTPERWAALKNNPEDRATG
jgi:S-DNA-T family DNA segregation ATPase FtsK/SpoIIIE